MKPLSLSERLNQFATDQDDLSRRGEKKLAAEAAQAIDSLTVERDQLAAQVEALKQGVYHFNCSHGDLNPLLKAVMESPKQCLDYIRAQTIRKFVIDTNETGQLIWPDCQWLEQWSYEWLEEAAKGGE